MTSVAVLDIVVPQGGNYRLVINVVGGPADLSTCTGAMQVRPSKSSTTVYAEADPSDFQMDQNNRQVSVLLPSADTALYDWDEGVYDVLITEAGGQSWRLVEGRARLSGSVTRED